MDFQNWMKTQLDQVELALSEWVRADAPAGLGEAMRYAVLDGGKRLRPLLTLASAEAANQHESDAAMRAACAVELIHAYSLVHDDMPCMDNDILRRGKPTVHVKFGQAQALLSGDALQALAFEILTPEQGVPDALQAQLCRMLARAAGGEGMAGGQAIDLAAVGHALTEAELARMHRLKTGALLHASVVMGAACAHQLTSAQRAALSNYGWAVGIAFQVVDDVLDVVGDASLGKTVGKDAESGKPTFVSLLGLDGARKRAKQLHADALKALDSSGLPNVGTLRELADLVVQRSF
jgi:farnesyl diphosphate synthase